MFKYIGIPVLALSICSMNAEAGIDTCLEEGDVPSNFDAVVESVKLGYAAVGNNMSYQCVIHLRNLSKTPQEDVSVYAYINNLNYSAMISNQVCSYFSTIYTLDRVLNVSTCIPKGSSTTYLRQVEFKRFNLKS